MGVAFLRQCLQELHGQAFECSIGVHELCRMERDGGREEFREDDPLRALPQRQSNPVFSVLEVGRHLAEGRAHLHGSDTHALRTVLSLGGAAERRCSHTRGGFQQVSARYMSHRSRPSR